MNEARERRMEVKLHQEKVDFNSQEKRLEYKSWFRKIELSITVTFFLNILKIKKYKHPSFVVPLKIVLAESA